MIRPAELGDAEAMGRVHVRAWQAAYRGVMPDEYLDGLSADERAAMWRGRVGRRDVPPVLVGVVDGEVAGFAAYGAEAVEGDEPSGRGQLYAINLDPVHWGKGVGRALLGRASAALRSLGYAEAVLWVVPQNARARGLYESEGWVPDGAEQTDDVFGVQVTDIRYVRRLV